MTNSRITLQTKYGDFVLTVPDKLATERLCRDLAGALDVVLLAAGIEVLTPDIDKDAMYDAEQVELVLAAAQMWNNRHGRMRRSR